MPENPYASDTRCWCPDDWREPFNKARCPQHGGAAYESERSKFWREGAAAKQAEIVKLLREPRAYRLALAEYAARREQGEDRFEAMRLAIELLAADLIERRGE